MCLGTGSGSFTCSDVSTDNYRSHGVALGDLDGDGDLDAVFANYNQQRNRVCLGNGSGGFTCSDAGTDAFASSHVVLADVNRDGKLDAVFADAASGNSEKSRLCIGNGSGGFTCSDIAADANDSLGVAVGSFSNK